VVVIRAATRAEVEMKKQLMWVALAVGLVGCGPTGTPTFTGSAAGCAIEYETTGAGETVFVRNDVGAGTMRTQAVGQDGRTFWKQEHVGKGGASRLETPEKLVSIKASLAPDDGGLVTCKAEQ
jgi:hypothetical protein